MKSNEKKEENESCLSFEKQLDEIRRPSIMSYFKDKNILSFMKKYINVDILIGDYRSETNNDNTIFEKLIEINDLTDNVLVKELIKSINIQLFKNIVLDENGDKVIKDKQSCDKILLHKLIVEFPLADLCNVDSMSIHQNVIQMKKDNNPYVLIYSERISDINISKVDVEHFYKEIKENNSCGILCNSNSGISNRDNFEIDIQDSNVYVFIPNHNYDIKLFRLAAQIIYNVYDTIKDNDGAIEIDKELLTRLKLEYNYFVTIRHKHLEGIKSNTIALEKLDLIQLDHFFKRTHINSEDKPYSCQMCGTKFGTDKSLKSHLKIKHKIQLGKKRNKKEIKEEKEDNVDNLEVDDGMVTFD
jgi:hypothetical protein